MSEYDPKIIEPKWQERWAKDGFYPAKDFGDKPKWYSLMEFPYPSGDGLHTGHVRGYTAMDIISRKRRMEGYNVLFPIGWDAFGLPTENYAIKTKRPPAEITKENTDNFRRQFQKLGMSFDWSREVNTTDPKYYKWTQWLFLKFLDNGLAYKARIPINWCPKDKIGLANEEVIDGKCERCGTAVEQKEKEQWMLAITKYADKLLNGLETVDYPERVKAQQRNWIGRSEGAEIEFPISNSQLSIKVFTTRPDTIYGATFLVKSGKVDRFTGEYVTNPATKEKIPVWEAEYVLSDYGTGVIMGVPAHDERDFEFAKKHNLPIKEVVIPRLVDQSNPHVPGKEVVFRDAIIAVVRNPKTNEVLQLKWKKHPWTTFVMGGIENGEDPVESAMREIREETGYKNIRFVKMLGLAQSEFFAAHKGVNRVAHTRNMLFDLIDEDRDEVSEEEKEIFDVVWTPLSSITIQSMTHSEMPLILERIDAEESAHPIEGVLFGSGEFTMMDSKEAREKITEKFGKKVVRYKLRDWVFSRQRYWGEPIPVIHCEKCGIVPVPEKDLPVTLPEVENYEPTDTGDSPLANIASWVNTTCPKCGGEAKRETDVMPNWAGSSWYFWRYLDTHNEKEFVSKEKLGYWMPVDWYNGGMEHTTLHLLYSRFWSHFLFDLGLVPTAEPYKKRTSHGLILAEGGEKMSKSKGNVINPDGVVEIFGADTLRLYEMFMGPFDQAIAWSEEALVGPRRFIEKVWKLQSRISSANSSDVSAGKHGQNLLHKFDSSTLLNQTIKKVSEDIENMRFNTAISALMILTNDMEKREAVSQSELEKLILMLAPFAPHAAEEIWQILGHSSSIHKEAWPQYDAAKLESSTVIIAVQINGKVRGKFDASSQIDELEAYEQALSMPEIKKWIGDKEVKARFFVPKKLVNFVVS